MFAANRTANVKGRITALTNSINTIKGAKAMGLPRGTKWANILLEVLIHANPTCPIHIGRANLRVIDKWLDAVKI